MNSNAMLREVGEALYGPRWQADIARDIQVADRTVRRWAAGANKVPMSVLTELRAVCRERILILQDVIDRLPPE